jgi:hypothetical protein
MTKPNRKSVEMAAAQAQIATQAGTDACKDLHAEVERGRALAEFDDDITPIEIARTPRAAGRRYRPA